MSELKPDEIKYGLIVIDPEQDGDEKEILHFCGYWNEPTQQDADYLREELMQDEEFGITEIAHRVVIIPVPDYILKEIIETIKENE